MEMDVERQRARKPLDDGDSTRLAVHDVVTPLRPSTQIGEDGANEGSQSDRTRLVVVREAVADPMGQREHPLPHGTSGIT